MKCSQCSKEKFVEMPIQIDYSDYGKLTGPSTTSINAFSAYLCVNCGHIELFSDKYRKDLTEIKELESKLAGLYKDLEDLTTKNKADKIMEKIKNIRQLEETPYDCRRTHEDRQKIRNTIGNLERELSNLVLRNERLKSVVESIQGLKEELYRKKAAFDEFFKTVE